MNNDDLSIILCAGKKEEQIEFLELDQSGIHVGEYLTALPSRELLQQKLHAAIEISRARLEAKDESDHESVIRKSRTTDAKDSKPNGGEL